MQTVFLAFGLTGDLMRQKGIPALFALYTKGELPSPFSVVGFSRKPWSKDDVEAHVKEVLQASGELPEKIEAFSKLFSVVQGDADTPESFDTLKERVGSPEQLVIYLCISPEFYAPTIEKLGEKGFLANGARILIEKPFGKSGEDAASLEALLSKYAKEEQVYRIDHYLAKVGALELAILNKADIEGIGVYLLESIGVEARGAAYDAVGALRDVGQNHLLEMLAIASGAKNRADALRTLPIMTQAEVAENTVRGQYVGYTQIDGVKPHSQIETYFKIKTSIASARGTHIAVIIEGGKMLGSTKKEVSLTYTGGSTRSISLASRGNEYEKLFADAFSGNQELFVSMGEVEALWKFIDPIVTEWEKGKVLLTSYEPGSGSIRGK
jgi:glucose-6-phosphate 1-dehydrogenase